MTALVSQLIERNQCKRERWSECRVAQAGRVGAEEQ